MGVVREYRREYSDRYVSWNVSEGEHLGRGWLKEIPWKGIPKKVTVLYLKIPLRSLIFFLSTIRPRESGGKQAGLPAKAKYLISPIVNQYREGKVKSREVIPVK